MNQQLQSAYDAAIVALGALQNAAHAARCPALLIEAASASAALSEAYEFDAEAFGP